jgi:hypothetical protein
MKTESLVSGFIEVEIVFLIPKKRDELYTHFWCSHRVKTFSSRVHHFCSYLARSLVVGTKINCRSFRLGCAAVPAGRGKPAAYCECRKVNRVSQTRGKKLTPLMTRTGFAQLTRPSLHSLCSRGSAKDVVINAV